MRFKVAKSDLQNALSLLVPVTNFKSPIPHLGHLLFHVSDVVYITATDLEIGARVKLKVMDSEPGTFTLSSTKLSDIVSNMPSDEITFVSKGDSIITISSGTASFRLQSLDVADYPVFADLNITETKVVDGKKFLDVLNNVLYAAVSNDDNRYNLNSIYFTEYNDLPCVVTTDGCRLALQYMKDPPFAKGTLIPIKGSEFIKRFLSSDGVKEVTVASDDNNIMLSTDDIMVIIRLIAGDYPDISKVIPTSDPETIIIVNTETFRASVKRVSLVNDQIHKGLIINSKTDTLEMTAVTPLGMASDAVNYNKSGGDCDCSFNSRYLLDTLGVIQTTDCQIKFYGGQRPIIFVGVSDVEEDGNGSLNLIMPLRK